MEENEVYKSLEAKIKRLEDEVSLSNHKHDESMVHVLSTTSFSSLLLHHLSHASPFITLTETYEQRGCWHMIVRCWSHWLKHANKHSRWGQWPMLTAAELLKWYGRYDPIPPTPLLSLTLSTALTLLTLLTLPTSPTLSNSTHPQLLIWILESSWQFHCFSFNTRVTFDSCRLYFRWASLIHITE